MMTKIFPSLRNRKDTYIVTGGAGFIGSHIVHGLLAAGATVIVFDDFSAGKLENLPTNNSRLTIHDVDLANAEEMKYVLPFFKDVSGVFHCAAQARIQPSILEPRKTFEANVIGTFNLLEAMRDCGVHNIVYSASSSSYGRREGFLREDMLPNCLNPYATTKLIGEELCKGYNIYDIHCVCLKYFNVYGPRSPLHLDAYSPVIGLFFKQILAGEPITVVGHGEQKRDFTHVDDVVRANFFAMEDLQCKKLGDGKTLNIGTGENITILELAQKIRDICADIRPNGKIEHIAARPGEANETLAHNYLALSILGFTPRIKLDEALPLLKTYYMDLFNVA